MTRCHSLVPIRCREILVTFKIVCYKSPYNIWCKMSWFPTVGEPSATQLTPAVRPLMLVIPFLTPRSHRKVAKTAHKVYVFLNIKKQRGRDQSTGEKRLESGSHLADGTDCRVTLQSTPDVLEGISQWVLFRLRVLFSLSLISHRDSHPLQNGWVRDYAQPKLARI